MSVREQNRRNSIVLGQDSNALTWLIIINAVVFVSLLFIEVIYQVSNGGDTQAFQQQIIGLVSLPGNASTFFHQPWTIISYMFSHNNIWYLIGSLLWLWCFGYILQDLAGNSKLFPLYFYGGVVGGASFLISANLIPSVAQHIQTVSAMGAAASVMAVAVATTVLAPNYRIFPMLNGGFPLWVITLVFIAIDFGTIGMTKGTNGAVAIAHVTSGLTGFLFVLQLRRGHDWGAWMVKLANWVNDLFNPEKKHGKDPFYYKATRRPFEKTPHITQQKIDELLDKINQQGYHFLTDDEKELLRKASKEDF